MPSLNRDSLYIFAYVAISIAFYNFFCATFQIVSLSTFTLGGQQLIFVPGNKRVCSREMGSFAFSCSQAPFRPSKLVALFNLAFPAIFLRFSPSHLLFPPTPSETHSLSSEEHGVFPVVPLPSSIRESVETPDRPD